jgi:hypothetical protein
MATTAQALTAAANRVQPGLILAATDGVVLQVASLVPGIDGSFTLQGPPGTPIPPTSEQAIGSAAFTVNHVASPLAAGSTNQTSPAPGITLTAHNSGRARVTVGHGTPPTRMPGAVLVVAILWVIALGVIGLQYPHVAVRWFGDHNYIFKYHVPRTFGPIPGSVPWFAAAGGLLISLQGIFTYNRAWDRSYDYWHYLRPVAGALVGSVAALLVLVLISTANASNNTSLAAAASNSQSTRILLASVAVLVGYREATFRSLISRVVDVVIGPGGASGGGSNAQGS